MGAAFAALAGVSVGLLVVHAEAPGAAAASLSASSTAPAPLSGLVWNLSALLEDVDWERDQQLELTVVDTSVCASERGRVRRFQFFLPDDRAPLPLNLTLGSFNKGLSSVFLRAAVAVPLELMQEVGGRRRRGRATHLQPGGRLLHVDLPGRGLPFAAGDCLGWSHAVKQGFAFHAVPEEEPVAGAGARPSGASLSGAAEVDWIPAFTGTGHVSSFRLADSFQRLRRRYAVAFVAEADEDAFSCFALTALSAGAERLMTRQIYEQRSKVSCCYYSPLMAKTYELPSCFGVVEDAQAVPPLGRAVHTWYHPSHCCDRKPLGRTVLDATRCIVHPVQQALWQHALHQAAACGQLCCPTPAGPCLAARLLEQRLGGDAAGDGDPRQPLAGAADCPAGAALLGLLRAADGDADGDTWQLQSAGWFKEGHCGIYGYDAAECCLHLACQGLGLDAPLAVPPDSSGLVRAARACAGCLLSEVPWGSWSRPQSSVLAHVTRRLAGSSGLGPERTVLVDAVGREVYWSGMPASLHVAIERLMQEAAAGAGAPAMQAGIAVGVLLGLLGLLVQAVTMLDGRPFLHDAIHSLQMAAPLRLVPPAVLADVLAELAPQEETGWQAPQWRPAETPLCARPSARRLAAAAVRAAAGEASRRPLCGAAASAFLSALAAVKRAEAWRFCCPRGAWPALVRAAAEGGCWLPAAAALCVLCEVAHLWEHGRLAAAVAAVDLQLESRSCAVVPDGTPCSGYTWRPLLRELKHRVLCFGAARGGAELAVPPVASLRRSDELGSAPMPAVRVFGYRETLAFLQAGGSLARMNDGEQLMMHPDFNAPLTRLHDTMLRLQTVPQAACPGLCIGLLHPDDEAALESLGPTHQEWWSVKGFRLTRALFDIGIFPANRSYCFGLATYRPKSGPDRMSTAEFAHAWDLVFANRTVLMVQPNNPNFLERCGDCHLLDDGMLMGGGRHLPPFRLVTKLVSLNPELLRYSHVVGSGWSTVVGIVRHAAARAGADTVAVLWGPFADILVSELACRGLRAVDIGNLMNILKGGLTARETDPDEG